MAADNAPRIRNLLVIILAITTGATDAAAFERLGHVFGSVITGNLILLGINSVGRDGTVALLSGCALAGYAIGVFTAAPRRKREEEALWPPAATVALVLDLGLLMGFAILWEIVGGHPGPAMRIALLGIAAGAMGVQSTAVRRLGQMSTTYLTSTLTGIVESVAARRWLQSDSRGSAIIAAAVAGAAAATALLLYADPWLPALQLLPLVVVLVGSRRIIGHPLPPRAAAGSSQ